jgi:photosystem II stability/assembly factor-like uncharacterized protein
VILRPGLSTAVVLPRKAWAAAFASLALALPSAPMAAGYRDVLEQPATSTPLAARGLFNGLARAGPRVVAVGQRGHILISDDAGATWTQARVPVSSDLVAVTFPTPTQGWAVGHDGVVLHSADAGATWTRQLDGLAVGRLVHAWYADASAKGELGSAEQAASLMTEAKRIEKQGHDNPFLDVWFADERTGFVVGAFNLILRTADGGKSWEPWMHRTDNPRALHLYAIREAGGRLHIAGEQGLLLRLDEPAGRFRALEIPYKGTLFGLAGGPASVVAFGLRGNAFRSVDGGKSWSKVETGLQVGLTGGAAHEGRLVLVSQAGHVLVSRDDGASFVLGKSERSLPAAAVVGAGAGALVIAGPRGVRAQRLEP